MFHDWFNSARVMEFSQSMHKYSKIITRVIFQSLNERFDQGSDWSRCVVSNVFDLE
jgi:hypothetical protein